MSANAAYPESNASFQSLRLLGQFMSSESHTLRELWRIFTEVLEESNATIRARDDSWEQDWFLAKYGAENPALGTQAWYAPPADLFEFPTFELDLYLEQLKDSGISITPTKWSAPSAPLFAQPPASAFAGPMVLGDFYELQDRIRVHGDAAMVQLNQTLAWFNTGLGKLFGGVALTPNLELGSAMGILANRWSRILLERDVYEEYLSETQLLQWKLDVFYGAEFAPDKLLMQPSRQGQPRQWQQWWEWMSQDVEREVALAATQLAARLMICPPILVFLKSKLADARREVNTEHVMALVVLRRLALELRAMAWLEQALQGPFEHLRAQDLASFAFSATRPHWPRRVLAISHRSMDIKPALRQLDAWGNFRYSIDALFVPHWETNVATIWGLFSAVPGLVRVASEHYDDSVWCRREGELLDYLRDSDDFLHGRHLVELTEEHLPLIDLEKVDDSDEGVFVRAGTFPPQTTVFILYPIEPWESRLLAVAAAVRFIFLKLGDPRLATFMCQQLAMGNLPPDGIPPLTNHPTGWAPIVALFSDFQRDWGDSPDRFPIAIDAALRSPDEIHRDLDCAESLINLSDGLVDQVAALAAVEWNRTVVPSLLGDNRYGSFFAVNYRRLTPETWRTDECMVIQGVNRVRTQIPLWILQRADQRVDEWPGIGSSPVFTQHAADQWHWMLELLQEPEWPDVFRNDCKLAFSDKLTAACAATRNRKGSEYYKGKV